MKVIETAIPGVLIVEPAVHGDHRGYFVETYQRARYESAGIGGEFVQDNLSRSRRGTLRGLHLQEPHGQGKLVSVVEGAVFDVAVDVRVGSETFGRWVGVELSAENHRQFWVPPGFAHGFCVTSEAAIFSYKCTDTYHPECEVGIAWDDPAIGIEWPDFGGTGPLLSARDREHPRLADVPEERLPRV